MINTLVVPCPACQIPLNVPPSAGGRRARCPACGDRFIIPTRTDAMDDTVSGWIAHDVDEMIEDRDHQTDLNQASQVRPAIRPQIEESSQPGETILGVPVEPQIIEQPKPKPVFRPRPVQVVRRKSAQEEQSEYPRNLRTDPKSPHLVVLKCGSAGVRLAFDAKWLGHEGFRASMPVRCIYSGNATRTKLIVRPMVFCDRSRARKIDVDEISQHHDIRSLGDRSTRELMNMMGTIEGMPSPFLYTMPYYISTRYAHKMLHCITRDRSSGGITAEVVIPDAVCALDWLARVNGVCGKEYELLERDASMLHGDAFQELSEVCRGRLQVWCKLRPQEIFQLYLNDADFGRLDEGLAGIVVTDQRIIYCKYHHRGQVRLDHEDAKILVRPDGRYLGLTLLRDEERARMCKLHKDDVPKLKATIGTDAALKVVEK